MAILIPVYSEQLLTADAMVVINEVLKEFPTNTFAFSPWDRSKGVPGIPGSKILVFGTISDIAIQDFLHIRNEPIYTYSVAQVTTKANAASVLKASLNQFYVNSKVHPKKMVYRASMTNFNMEAPIAIDVETAGNLDTETPEQVGLLTVSFYQEGSGVFVWRHDLHTIAILREYLSRVKLGIWHNGKFDIRVLEANTGVRLCIYFDTMLAHHVLNQGAGDHKLKNLARRYLGAPEWEKDLSKYTVGGAYYENIPMDLLVEYNAWDVYWTYELWKFLEPQILADENISNAYLLEVSASDMLMEVERYGFAVDRTYLNNLEVTLTLEKDAVLMQLRAILLDASFNPGSWQQVQKALTKLSGIYYTASTDEKSLAALRKSNSYAPAHIFIDKLLEYRKVSKSLSTYVIGVQNRVTPKDRIHTTFLIHGTSTGRLSSSGPNIQNIPRDKKFRSIFIG